MPRRKFQGALPMRLRTRFIAQSARAQLCGPGPQRKLAHRLRARLDFALERAQKILRLIRVGVEQGEGLPKFGSFRLESRCAFEVPNRAVTVARAVPTDSGQALVQREALVCVRGS